LARPSREENAKLKREALLAAGLKVVATHGYAKASVSRIAAASGVSLGSLYSYFPSHQDLLDELLPAEGERLLAHIQKAARGTGPFFERERLAFSAFYDFVARRPSLLRVLVEAEIAAPGSYVRLMDTIRARYYRALEKAVANGEIRASDDHFLQVATHVLTGTRGIIAIGFSDREGNRFLKPGKLPDWVADTYLKFVRHGLDDRKPFSWGKSDFAPPLPPVAPDTRLRLMLSAAQAMQAKGFAGTTVADIVQGAGVAVGTFYIHFQSREELFDALLTYARAEMLSHVQHEITDSRSIAEVECRGFRALTSYLIANPWHLRVEMEASLWVPKSYLKHFFEIADRYTATLSRFHRAGELLEFREEELPVVSLILMAPRRYLATRLIGSETTVEQRHRIFDDYARLIRFGLSRR